MIKIQNYINGQFQDPVQGSFLDNVSPSNGEVYSQVPDSDEMDIAQAVVAARKAFPSWSKLPAQDRANYLYKIADLIDANLDRLAEAESRDQGKPLKLAKTVDIPRASANFRFFAGEILHSKNVATDTDGKAINYTLKQPLGVAGLISPWNLPLYLLTWKIAPALATGNVAICKPSELTPMTAFLLGEILTEAGLPPGVCNIVHGLGPKTGGVLVEHPSVPIISFTGGTATGKVVYKGAADNFKKISLELGGKNPNIIFKDADLNKAITMTIESSFRNQGEICLCGSRIFVHQDVYDEFIEKFKAKTDELVVGDPMDEDSYMGALVSEGHLNKVMGCIEKAKKDGGKIVSGGERVDRPGFYLRPTIITDLDRCSEIMQTEIFGPVVTVTPFRTQNEVIEWANSVDYGLSATVWTKDIGKAHRVAAKLDVGTVWINTWMLRDLRVPFGGMKASGVGREGGDKSIDFFTETKTVSVGL